MITQTSGFAATESIRHRFEAQTGTHWTPPQIGIVLGSGLGQVAEFLENPFSLPYHEIPGFQVPSVAGHSGRLLLGKTAGIPVAFLQGRLHPYEGYSMHQSVFPLRTLCQLGVRGVFLTNAAGGVNPEYRPGDLMLISDHINLMGNNPLVGPPLAEFEGPRFPDLSQAYDPQALEILKQLGDSLNIPLRTGVYAGLLGPNYETPAEVRMLRVLGADAVGMSTVHECIAARHLSVPVAGLSCISNLAAGLSHQALSHAEVVENSARAAQSITRLIQAAIPLLARRFQEAS